MGAANQANADTAARITLERASGDARTIVRDLQAENDRLRKVIAHLMTNPLGTREVTHHTSDIDAQTGRVDIIDHDNDRTTIRITEQ